MPTESPQLDGAQTVPEAQIQGPSRSQGGSSEPTEKSSTDSPTAEAPPAPESRRKSPSRSPEALEEKRSETPTDKLSPIQPVSRPSPTDVGKGSDSGPDPKGSEEDTGSSEARPGQESSQQKPKRFDSTQTADSGVPQTGTGIQESEKREWVPRSRERTVFDSRQAESAEQDGPTEVVNEADGSRWEVVDGRLVSISGNGSEPKVKPKPPSSESTGIGDVPTQPSEPGSAATPPGVTGVPQSEKREFLFEEERLVDSEQTAELQENPIEPPTSPETVESAPKPQPSQENSNPPQAAQPTRTETSAQQRGTGISEAEKRTFQFRDSRERMVTGPAEHSPDEPPNLPPNGPAVSPPTSVQAVDSSNSPPTSAQLAAGNAAASQESSGAEQLWALLATRSVF